MSIPAFQVIGLSTGELVHGFIFTANKNDALVFDSNSLFKGGRALHGDNFTTAIDESSDF
ncbi:MAG: hypothetical protein RIF33_18865 [Cyclobacteriaceae bacterium]